MPEKPRECINMDGQSTVKIPTPSADKPSDDIIAATKISIHSQQTMCGGDITKPTNESKPKKDAMRSLVEFVESDLKAQWSSMDLSSFSQKVKMQVSMLDVLLKFDDPDVHRIITELRPKIFALQYKIDNLKEIEKKESLLQNAIVGTTKPIYPPTGGTGNGLRRDGLLPVEAYIRHASMGWDPNSADEKLRMVEEAKNRRIAMGWAMGGSGRTTPAIQSRIGGPPPGLMGF